MFKEDEEVFVSQDRKNWTPRHYYRFKDDKHYVWPNGQTSHTSGGYPICFKYCMSKEEYNKYSLDHIKDYIDQAK